MRSVRSILESRWSVWIAIETSKPSRSGEPGAVLRNRPIQFFYRKFYYWMLLIDACFGSVAMYTALPRVPAPPLTITGLARLSRLPVSSYQRFDIVVLVLLYEGLEPKLLISDINSLTVQANIHTHCKFLWNIRYSKLFMRINLIGKRKTLSILE